LGGFVGESTYNPAQDNYWDSDTSGASVGCSGGSCVGVTALSDAQLKSGLPAGFDPTIWAQSPGINNGYPPGPWGPAIETKAFSSWRDFGMNVLFHEQYQSTIDPGNEYRARVYSIENMPPGGYP
jgi:hypothetical protein